MNLHEEFERLSKKRNEIQLQCQQTQAKLESIDDRMKELSEEAAKLGVEDISKIEEFIKMEEVKIEEELNSISTKLSNGIQSVSTIAVIKPQEQSQSTSLDDLLEAGTST